MNPLKGIILAVIVTMLVVTVRGQEIAAGNDLSKETPGENPQQLISANYGFSIQAGVALEDMSSDTTELIGPGTDNNNSIATSTGFLFRFLGNTVTNSRGEQYKPDRDFRECAQDHAVLGRSVYRQQRQSAF